MDSETVIAALDFMDRITKGQNFKIIFHGGEPLLPGPEFYQFILPLLRERFGRRAVLSIQSNLWAMNEELAELFRAYEVSVGTSIDGFQEMCDDQRGPGYYEKNRAGAALLEAGGNHAGRICTFTADHAEDAVRVFREAEAPYSIHGAVPTYGEPAAPLCLSPEQFTGVLRDTYHAYRNDLFHTRVGLIDSMASALLNKKSGLCTFSACLGEYAAITPNGDVYSCQRFAGIKKFCFGNLLEGLDEEGILNSEAYRLLSEKAAGTKEACGDCIHYPNCNGGCLYSAFTSGAAKDPYCGTYKTVFDEMLIDLGKEIADVMQGRNRPTPVLSMAGDRPHPYDERIKRERIRRALETGKTPGASYGPVKYPGNQLNKVFFNITRRCPLHCSHCWAGNREDTGKELSPERLTELVQEAADMHFRRIVITGGEPLVYQDFDRLLDLLGKINKKGAELILRTSFAFRIPEGRLRRIAEVFDLVIVSIDGTRDSHDARRGLGTYDKAVENLELFAKIAGSRKLGLWSVLDPAQRTGAEGEAVKELGKRMGMKFIHFDALKPMGNACFSMCDLTEDLPARAENLRVRPNCGLGHILHIEPDGKAYPCYTCMTEDTMFADLSRQPLADLNERLFDYARRGVDNNEKCSSCSVRYLCGGLCLAYRPHPEQPENGEFNCKSRRKAILNLLKEMPG